MFQDKLNDLKKNPNNRLLLMMFIGGFIIFLIINFLVFQPLGAAVTVYNILDYEFAWVPEQVIIIFAAWGPSGMVLQAFGIYWDFLYIIGYVSPQVICHSNVSTLKQLLKDIKANLPSAKQPSVKPITRNNVPDGYRVICENGRCRLVPVGAKQ